MTTIDYIVIAAFMLGVIAAGMSFSGSGKNMRSFFAGGGAVPWWISGLSLFMSFFSAGTFVAWGSLAYMHGWIAVSVQWTMCISGFIIAAFLAARWRKTGVLTGSEFIGKRLGENVQKAYTYLFLAISVFTSGAFLYPVAKIVEGATGLPFAYAAIGLSLGILAYTAVGGLWAVIVTDVLQFVILTAAVVIILPLAFEKIGGVGGLLHQAPEGFFALTNDKYTPLFMIGFGLYNLCFIAGNWAYVQRYTSVRTPADARKAALLFGGLYTICPVIWMLPPMIYRIINPQLDLAAGEANHAYMHMARLALPEGMLGLMVGAMVFATASSVNTTWNIVSGVFTNDIYRHLRTGAGDRELMRVARLSTVGFGLLTMVVALSVDHMGGILDVIWGVAAITGGAMYIPMLWALFSKVHTGESVLGTTVFCLGVNALFKWGGLVQLSEGQTQAVGSMLPLALMAAYEVHARRKVGAARQYLKYENERREREAKERIERDAGHHEDSTRVQNARGARVIGIGIAAVGILMILLALIAENGGGLVAAVGSIIAVLGAGLIGNGMRSNNDRMQSSDKTLRDVH